MSIQVLLADDHQMIREGLKAVLENEGFEVVGETADGREAVLLSQKCHPDVAILDIAMPALNGLDAAREILRLSPRTKAVILTTYAEDPYVLDALRSGVSGYVLKTQAADDLVLAIRDVVRGSIYLSPAVSRAVVEAFRAGTDRPTDPLSQREREVLQLVAEGKSTKEIAILLGISTKTAESHRRHIRSKLNLHETASLVRYAIRRGLVRA
jgi:DNA-binding NarL/FixJ family response regulator